MRPGFVTITKSFDLGYGVRNISSLKLRLGKAFFVARVATEFGERVGNLPLRYAAKGGALSNPYDSSESGVPLLMTKLPAAAQ